MLSLGGRTDIKATSTGTRTQQFHSLPKRLAWATFDVGVWAAALFGAMLLRFEFNLDIAVDRELPLFIAVAALGTLLIGFTMGPYGARQQWGSFEETIDIARSATFVGAVLFFMDLAISGVEPKIPRSVPIMAFFLSLCFMFAGRFVKRSWDTLRLVNQESEHRALIFGAGVAGRSLVRSMRYDMDSGYRAMGFIDDDKRLRRKTIEGIRVLGNRSVIANAVTKTEANTLIVAASHVDGAVMRDLSEIADEHGLRLLSVPPVADVIEGQSTSVRDLRDMDLAELLGRRPVSLDHQSIASQISGKKVLVTGAGGSIGSELCRQIDAFGPAKLYMLDRDESGLQSTQMSISGHGLLTGDELILADIRDPERLMQIFTDVRPDIVFHAAALKHLTLLEHFPHEAWKSNVVGTLNVLRAAAAAEVQSFINISTDKAANPTCNLGYSKRLAERLTSQFSVTYPGSYVSVRFGNVLGSRGSVVHVFTEQIKRGGPVTLTHREVKRYFMLIPEACQLVLQASAMGSAGEVLVLDMGEPMAIRDLAENLIRRSGRSDVSIVYTGLRPGEKLSEELFGGLEPQRPTDHHLVSAVSVPPIRPDSLSGGGLGPDELQAWMRAEAFGGREPSDDADAAAFPLSPATAVIPTTSTALPEDGYVDHHEQAMKRAMND